MSSLLCSGTIWSDFKPQIEGLDKSKFTVVVMDPVGYGKSRPPNRTFDVDFYKKDAKFSSELMKASISFYAHLFY